MATYRLNFGSIQGHSVTAIYDSPYYTMRFMACVGSEMQRSLRW